MKLSGGLSGCDLYLKDGIVTKTSPLFSYNDRLEKQMIKQINFQSDDVIVPKVFGSGLNDEGFFYFNMLYEIGSTYSSFLNISSIDEIRLFASSLIKYLKKSISTELFAETEIKDSILTKMETLKKYLASELFNFISIKISQMDASKVMKGRCHGDLTLSNILVREGRPIFIDFLDSYIESPLIDIVKLKQDLYYFWSFHKDYPGMLSLRAAQTSFFIWKHIENEFSEYINTETFRILEFVNFARIYPYAKDPKSFQLLENLIKTTSIYEEFNSTDCREVY